MICSTLPCRALEADQPRGRRHNTAISTPGCRASADHPHDGDGDCTHGQRWPVRIADLLDHAPDILDEMPERPMGTLISLFTCDRPMIMAAHS
jgi:hypothetical protein